MFLTLVPVVLIAFLSLGAYVGMKRPEGTRVTTWAVGAAPPSATIAWSAFEVLAHGADNQGGTGLAFFMIGIAAGFVLIGWTLGMMFGSAISER
jgi:hypothetical protein